MGKKDQLGLDERQGNQIFNRALESKTIAKESLPEGLVRKAVANSETLSNVSQAGKVHKSRASSKHQMAACCFCKRRRKKCDGGYPSCGPCKLNDVHCTVIDIPTAREVPRNYMESLESKVEQLKKELAQANTVALSRPSSCEESDDSKNSQAAKDKGLPLEVGYITLTAAGEPRYIGASSAYSIAKAIHSTINYYQKQKPSDYYDDIDDSIDAQLALEPQVAEATFTKPSKTESRQLLRAFHYGVQYQYPFLDWNWVLICFEKVIKNHTEEDEALFFIYMIFAIGSQLLEHSAGTYSGQHTRAYYDKAFEHIGPIVEGTTLRAVQAYLLLSVFSQKMPYGSSIWQTTGLALRASVALGLHRKPYKRKEGHSEDDAGSIQDLKSRIFWCAYSMERINGLVLGRPFGIADADIDVPLPQSDKYKVAVHVFKLRMLQSSICSFVYKPRSNPANTQDTNSTRHQIMLELNEWKSTFPSKTEAKTTWETDNWCTISYHNSVLLLLRPVVLEVAGLKKNTPQSTIEWFNIFTQSASAICFNYKQLHAKKKLSYTWLAIQCVFVAGVSFLYCTWLDSSLKYLELTRRSIVYDTVSACSNILYVLAERWDGAHIFRNSFERLSKAVLENIERTSDEQPKGSMLLTSADYGAPTDGVKNINYLGCQTNLNEDLEFTPISSRQQYALTDGLSFTIPQSGSNGSSPLTADITGTGDIESDLNSKSVWEFLSSTADSFVKDMFCDLEKAFDKY